MHIFPLYGMRIHFYPNVLSFDRLLLYHTTRFKRNECKDETKGNEAAIYITTKNPAIAGLL